ncbi:hypothetical protein C5L14_15340 [Labrys okinawensis]|uniref:Uncharacterized protein n=1 Tax=Labrys okinawensis TaxID=346911 RepID=A0A2S9QBF5_9HYPH|nr:hypothetical protein [Labrys okinawensis]PRH86683.1 hypothetical protein C5L14_15340 [Labrys okinawensis]
MSRLVTGLAGTIILAIWPALSAVSSELVPWPPHDPGQPEASIAITKEWITSLREIHDFAGLQKAAGSGGRLLAVEADPETPRAIYGWKGLDGRGQMKVFLYRTGDFGIAASPADGAGEITLNNAGAFVCPTCSPPVHACGRRPSWVSHSVHWDGSDCHCTITGPQTIRPGPC